MKSISVVLFTAATLITCSVSESTRAEVFVAKQQKCVLQEPLYNATFDLTGLKSTQAHTYSLPGVGDFSFNMCDGTVPSLCNGVKDVGACLKLAGTGKELILGYGSADALLRDAIIYFNYAGAACEKNAKANYSLVIKAECDYNHEVDPISLIKKGDCDFMLNYKSAKACLQSVAQHNCEFHLEQNASLNLAQLPKGNQRVEEKERDKDFFVSVCRPVIYTPSSACPPDTNVCVFDKKTKTFSSIGGPQVTLMSDHFTLNYQSSTKCDLDSTRNVTTLINLKCDPKQSNKISYIGYDSCTYNFDWLNPLGCQQQRQPCVAYDPVNDFTYDLRSLSKQSYNVTRNEKTYSFGICNGATECVSKNVGACSDAGVALGAINGKLTVNETGLPYLLYENGAPCKGKEYFTRIEFSCAEDDQPDNQATILEDGDCRLIIQFATRLACPKKQISCSVVDGGTTYDLSPLMRDTINYEAEIDSKLAQKEQNVKYYINVCRPLRPQYGLSCHGGSAICRADVSSGKPENETSLGFPDVSLSMDNSSSEGAVPQLKYLRGDKCKNGDEASTTINFKCNAKIGRGKPVLKEIEEDCHYKFQWETNVICPNALAVVDACQLKNAETGKVLDMKQIGKGGVVTLASNQELNLCQLNGSKATVDYFSQLVYLRTTATPSTEVIFECREKTKSLVSEFTGEFQYGVYNYTVKYIDPATCALFGESVDSVELSTTSTTSTTTTTTSTVAPVTTVAPAKTPTGNETSATPTKVTSPVLPSNGATTTTTLAPGNKEMGSPAPAARSGVSAWGITGILFLLCGIFVLVGLVLRSPHRRAKIMSVFRRNNVPVSYTRGAQTEEANLLMIPAGLSESDDELLV